MLMPAAGASDGDSAKKRSRRSASERDCIAEGGRYDDLVMRFRRPGDRTPLPVACGVRFAVGKIASSTLVAAKVSAAPKTSASHSHPTPTEAQGWHGSASGAS